MKQLTTDQRLAHLIELKAQRDEIDREIAVLLGEAPPSARVVSSGNSQTLSHPKTIESADGSFTADPNGSGS
jgi:hypothetical protein